MTEVTSSKALSLLREALGPEAEFRDGQLEAILTVVDEKARVLVVQRTGWGKSVVYFVAARLLRDAGLGPALLVSPLLSLMHDQIRMAERLGVRAVSITSENKDDWDALDRQIKANEVDLLLVSPERLANPRFVEQTLPLIQGAIGLFVVDEAHCISDWGHDFRPDYRRIGRLVGRLPANVPLLATTATANDRVVSDIDEQIGPDMRIIRGPLGRRSLRLQTMRLDDQAQRLAWLAREVPHLEGTGIIYCLTIADCERVSAWLSERGVDCPAYHGTLDPGPRRDLEERLRRNEVKALVATIALGMGFDKPDLGFVIHFQRPGSPVAYYQQIGRAGRALDDAVVVLLHGREDDSISEYFIDSAFPPEDQLLDVLGAIEASDGLKRAQLEETLNLSRGRLTQCLKILEIDGAIFHEGVRYIRSANSWTPERERIALVTAQREHELERMGALTKTTDCLMEFLRRELDDPAAEPCGRCANCVGAFLPSAPDPDLVNQAIVFLRRAFLPLQERKQWPGGDLRDGWTGAIKPELRAEPGRALSRYGDAGWGHLVQDAKLRGSAYAEDLVDAIAKMFSEEWRPAPAPEWVTAIPSLRSETLQEFADRLAARLGLPYRHALKKARSNLPQKSMQNSFQQARNVVSAFEVDPAMVGSGPVLLVDDVVDSGWTFTVCAALLREAGAGPVFPLALASSARGDR